MQPTWILVADRVRARLFSPSAEGDGLDELKDFINPTGRKPGLAFNYDHPPQTVDTMVPTRSDSEPKALAEEKVTARFAHELSDVLERGRVDHRYERLILAAPPAFLGALRNALGKQVRSCVVAQLDKDLSTLPAAEIHQQLARQIGH